MHEFDGSNDTPREPYDPSQLEQAAERLQQQDITIGVEGDPYDDSSAHTPAGAFDPTIEISTHEIGNGYDDPPDESFDDEPDDPPDDQTDEVQAEAKAQPEEGPASRAASGAAALALNEVTGAIPEGTPAEETPVAENLPETADTPPASDEFDKFGDTRITPAEVIEKFDSWDRGEVVESSSTAIVRIEASAEEVDSLRDKVNTVYGEYAVRDGRELSRPDNPYLQGQTGYSEAQLTTFGKLSDRFITAVREDAARNGFGEPRPGSFIVEAGTFDPGTSPANTWHVDQPGARKVRYVLAFGDAGPTRFAHGPIHKDSVDIVNGAVTDQASINTAPGGSHQEITHGTGVLTRFFTSNGLHASPTERGFRLFFSVDVPVQPAEPKRTRRR